MTKVDLRIVKTRKVLFETLIKLMKTKSFEEIKVSDICNEALINRSTFYSHYKDKYELLIDCINNLKEPFNDALKRNNNIVNTKKYYMEMISLLLDHIEENKDLYYNMLLANRNSIVFDILLDNVNEDLKKHTKNVKETNKVPSELVSRFYLGAISSIALEWITNNLSYTKKELLEYINYLIPESIN